jgi:hypothetical protein
MPTTQDLSLWICLEIASQIYQNNIFNLFKLIV